MNHQRNKAALRSQGALGSLVHTYRRPMEMRLPLAMADMAAVAVIDAEGNRREIVGRAYQQLPAVIDGGAHLLPAIEGEDQAEHFVPADFAARVSSAWPYRPGEAPKTPAPVERILSACGFEKAGA